MPGSSKPEALKFDSPQNISVKIWYHYYKALREMGDQAQAQKLLVASTLHLCNNPDFSYFHATILYAMTKEQMALLPIEQFKKPEIRLLLACLTQRLDDKMIETANDLFDSKGGDFFNFFRRAYKRNDEDTDEELESKHFFAFKKDIQYLKNLLVWVLDRP